MPSKGKKTKHSLWVFLTFDDGPDRERDTINNTEVILDILREFNIKATFFVERTQIETEKGKDLLKKISKSHELGIHGVDPRKNHKKYQKYNSLGNLRKQIIEMKERMESICGITPRFIRPPGGGTTIWMDKGRDPEKKHLGELDKLFEELGLRRITGDGTEGYNSWAGPEVNSKNMTEFWGKFREYIRKAKKKSFSEAGRFVALFHDDREYDRKNLRMIIHEMRRICKAMEINLAFKGLADYDYATYLLEDIIDQIDSDESKTYFVSEEYVDPGKRRKNPKYVVEILDSSAKVQDRGNLDHELEHVRVGIKAKFNTVPHKPNDRNYYLTLNGAELAERLNRLRMLYDNCIQPPGDLRGVGPHSKLLIGDYWLDLKSLHPLCLDIHIIPPIPKLRLPILSFGEEDFYYTEHDNEEQSVEYQIQVGDTLSKIASRFGMTWSELYDYAGNTDTPNSARLKSGNPALIFPNEVIIVPTNVW